MSEGQRLVERYAGAPSAEGLLARDIDAAIREAEAAMQERCAKVADSFAVSQYADPKCVARAIRKGDQG